MAAIFAGAMGLSLSSLALASAPAPIAEFEREVAGIERTLEQKLPRMVPSRGRYSACTATLKAFRELRKLGLNPEPYFSNQTAFVPYQ